MSAEATTDYRRIWIGGTSGLARTFFNAFQNRRDGREWEDGDTPWLIFGHERQAPAWLSEFNGLAYRKVDFLYPGTWNEVLLEADCQHVQQIVISIRPPLVSHHTFSQAAVRHNQMIDGFQEFLQAIIKFRRRSLNSDRDDDEEKSSLHIIHVSSIAAIDHVKEQRLRSEASIPDPPSSSLYHPYDRFKRRCEEVLDAIVKEHATAKVTHVRLGAFFSDDKNCIQCSALALQGRIGCYLPTRIDCNSAKNVAVLLRAMLEQSHPVAAVRYFFYTRPLSFSSPVPYGEYLAAYRRAYDIAEALRYPPSASGSGKLSLPVNHLRQLKDNPPKSSDIRTAPPTLVPTTSPTAAPTLSPTEEDDKKDDDDDDDDDIGENMQDTESPTVSPTLSPTSFPMNAPTTQPTNPPTKDPTLSPTDPPTLNPSNPPTQSPITSSPTIPPSPTVSPTTSSPSIPPTPSPTLSFEPSSRPTVTSRPSLAPTTASPVVLLTTSVELETFEMTVSWDNGFPTAQGLEQQVEADMRAYFPNFFASFVDVELQTDGIQIDEVTRRQLQTTNRVSIEFSGRMMFEGTEQITQEQVWALQSDFLESYALPADSNVQLESITLDSGATFTPAAAGTDGTDRGAPEEEESSGSFSAYGTVVGALVGGISFALMGGVYYLRRSRGGYQAHDGVQNVGLYEMDPEENTTVFGKPYIEVDTTDRGGGSKGDSTTPTTLGSETSEHDQNALSPSSTEGGNRSTLSPASSPEEQLSSHSLLSGVLPSLVEENSHEVVAETYSEELVAEVGDENLDVSVMVDADEEFAAVPADKEPPTSTAVVNATTYSNWVTPLLRQFDSSTRDCCVKGAARNVMDTTMPHDLLVSDFELAEQRQAQTPLLDAPGFNTTFDEADINKEIDLDKNKTASPSDAEENAAIEEHPDDESAPDKIEHPTDEMELGVDGEEDGDNEDMNNPMRLYSAKYQPHPAMFHRLSNATVSEDSSLNLSQQASFMTDDLDVGTDLLEKALRDVTLYNPDEEENTEFQVEEYMHRVRREAIELQQASSYDEDVKEVTL
eukprot:scaffold1170_cov174-Amphora_coffeaeformis.AAC.8